MKAVLIIVAVIVLLVVVSQSFFTIDETEQAIITQFGEYKKTVKSPGLHTKIPFVQVVHRYEDRIIASDAPPGEYLDSDKKRLEVDHVTRFRIADPLQFFKSVRQVEVGLSRLQAVVFSELRDELALHPTAEIISVKREQIMDTVAQRVREKVDDFGMQIVKGRPRDFELRARSRPSR
jgi:membrane protease subunit HflC